MYLPLTAAKGGLTLKPCVVCGHPAMDQHLYCARCFKFIENTPQKLIRRAAMIAAWNKEAEAILCYYTGIRLEEYDTASPFYLTFDHLVPGDKTKVAACARFINELKDAMSEKEFRTNIPLLAHHFLTGEPINRLRFRVRHFHDKARKKTAKVPQMNFEGPLWDWQAETCGGCGRKPDKASLYCGRCKRILANQHDDWVAKAVAMMAAYDQKADGFRCHYTGFLVDLKDVNNPFHFNFDHKIPRQPGAYNLVCYIVNLMKTSLSEEEFRKVVVELARHFETGEPYDRDVIKFEYWDRPRKK
jgi:hypothetical protein